MEKVRCEYTIATREHVSNVNDTVNLFIRQVAAASASDADALRALRTKHAKQIRESTEMLRAAKLDIRTCRKTLRVLDRKLKQLDARGRGRPRKYSRGAR